MTNSRRAHGRRAVLAAVAAVGAVGGGALAVAAVPGVVGTSAPSAPSQVAETESGPSPSLEQQWAAARRDLELARAERQAALTGRGEPVTGIAAGDSASPGGDRVAVAAPIPDSEVHPTPGSSITVSAPGTAPSADTQTGASGGGTSYDDDEYDDEYDDDDDDDDDRDDDDDDAEYDDDRDDDGDGDDD